MSRGETEHDLTKAFGDAEMAHGDFSKPTASLHNGQWQKVNWLLSVHRSRLVTEVHSKQEALFCVDLVIRELKEAQRPRRQRS